MTRTSDTLDRRTLLASVGGLVYVAFGAYVWSSFEPERGEALTRELLGDGNSLLYVDSERSEVAESVDVFGDDDPEEIVVAEHVEELQEIYGSIRYRLELESASGRDWFDTSVGVFDTVDVGDHLTYQTPVFDRRQISSVSCIADDRESLRDRCEFEETDPTQDGPV